MKGDMSPFCMGRRRATDSSGPLTARLILRVRLMSERNH